MENILRIQDINFAYGKSKILSDINIDFEKGKIHAIIGKSGSGKTTLLSVISGISKCQDGKVIYNQKELKNSDLGKYRKDTSIIFQDFNLIGYLNAVQNIVVGLDIINYKGDKNSRAIALLKSVGIPEKDWYRACVKLSGGQQQRVAIARALAIDSDVIFADEPTGNLDSKTRNEITDLLYQMAHEYGKCVICVTHDEKFRKKADVVLKLRDGKIVN